MNVTYTPAATQDPDNYRLMQVASRMLEGDILGHHAPTMTAVWDQIKDANEQPVYTLNLRNPETESTRKFTPADLRSSTLEVKLRLLWDDIMRIELNRWVESLKQRD